MPTDHRKRYPFHQSPFYRLTTKRRLAELLQLSPAQLRKLSQATHLLYTEWDEVDEEKGKTRHIENPKRQLKRIQRRVAALLSRIEPPGFLFCPVKGRSYIDNARQHVDGRVVRTLDIRAYFPSTPSRRVYWFFHQQLQCAPDVAGILTALATYKGRLPTGSPLSPMLSYFAHMDMWEEVRRITESAGCTLTVYMDDLTLSGPRVPERVVWAVKQKIHRCGLRYHKEKRYSGGVAEITGVIVKDGELMLPNRQHRKLHALRKRLLAEANAEEVEHLKKKITGRRAQLEQIVAKNS